MVRIGWRCPAFLLVLLVAGVAAVPLAWGGALDADEARGWARGEAPEAGVGDRLWFTHRSLHPPHETFTTFAPASADVPRTHDGLAEVWLRYWSWHLPALNVSWELPQGATWEARLWFSDLDQVLPTGNPEQDPLSIGSIRIEVQVLRFDEAVGVGSIEVSPLDAQAEATEHRIPVEFADRQMVDADEPELTIRIAVYARGILGTQAVVFHYAAPGVPSSLDAPGFPTNALRAYEEAALKDQECARLLLEQRACPEPQDDGADDGATQAIPLPAPAMFAILVALLIRRSRRA